MGKKIGALESNIHALFLENVRFILYDLCLITELQRFKPQIFAHYDVYNNNNNRNNS